MERSNWLSGMGFDRHVVVRITAVLLLLLHAVLLAWGASQHSPTLNEPAHLAAGISHCQFGRFELFRVNPPLVRMLAALPVLAVGCETDWSGFYDSPGARPAAAIGERFIKVNGERSLKLFTWARWACIPLSLLGGYFCFRWARELYGATAGLLALTLWCFSPNIIAHGQLITPDCGAAALGVAAGYFFWRWLHSPTWGRTLAAGVALGLAELTKTSWLILFALWPILWCFWQLSQSDTRLRWKDRLSQAGKLLTIVVLAVYLLNLGYGFEGTLTRLGDYKFVSETLTGASADHRPGNRFADSWVGALPVPLPKNYIQGIDVQKRDFENFGRPSYLRGEFRDRGWWYYYLYAAAIKVPLGTWLLALLSLIIRCACPGGWSRWRNEVVLLTPAVALFVLVSSQTGFNHHFRYVLPAFPWAFIWISGLRPAALGRKTKVLVAVALLWSVGSSLSVYPHSLSYFNELAGGPTGGHNHLINSNIDWGQDLLYVKQWLVEHPEARPFHLAYYGYFDPKDIGIDYLPVPERPPNREVQQPLEPGWYAVSVNYLRGYPWRAQKQAYSYFQQHEPVAMAGYSIYIYRVESE
jgi:4-amino-4-deoxy-L-arabinose transferase-like glycosyltransferase